MRLASSTFFLAALTLGAIACKRPNPAIQSDPQSPRALVSVASSASSAPVASVAPSPKTAPSASDAPLEVSSAAPTPSDPESAGSGSAHAAPRSARDQDAVREATFRYVMGKNASGQGKGAAVYCLEIESGKDPSPQFLRRFHNVGALVRPTSACDASADRGVVDKATGKHGLVLRVESMSFIDDDHVDVAGGYYEAGLSASGNTYSLERKKSGGWIVTHDVMHWIS